MCVCVCSRYIYGVCVYVSCSEALSEAVKLLKAEYLVKAITSHKMDQAIIFCRTKLDCDNIENYLQRLGGGGQGLHPSLPLLLLLLLLFMLVRSQNYGQ